MKSRSHIRVMICLVLYLGASHALADPIEKLEARVRELEVLVKQLLAEREEGQAESQESAEATKGKPSKILTSQVEELISENEELHFLIEETSQTLENRINIAGYADVEYKGSSEQGGKEEFRMHHLSLFFTRQFDNNIKFFSEIEYEDAPKFDGVNDGSGEIDEASGTIFVEAMNFDWNYSQHLNLRVGRFFSPAGVWSEDHYPPFVSTQERPMHIFKIFPQFVDGVSGFGTTYLTDTVSFDYNMFLGNGESSISGKKDLNSQKGVGFRGNFNFPVWDELTLGFTLYNDNEDTANGNADKSAMGVHLEARYGDFALQMEYANSDLKFADSFANYKREGFYAQFMYHLDNWALGYRHDTYQQTNLIESDTKRHSLFMNYHVNESITLKSEYHLNKYSEPLIDDFGFYIFSISTYLGK